MTAFFSYMTTRELHTSAIAHGITEVIGTFNYGLAYAGSMLKVIFHDACSLLH